MAPSTERRVALGFARRAVGWLGGIFLWVCLLSFSPADPPSHSVWPPNDPPGNLCGAVGAWIAYQLFYHFGVGTYALVVMLMVVVLTRKAQEGHIARWMRFLGVLIVTSATCAWGTLLITSSEGYLLSGPGGTVGMITAGFLDTYLQNAGAHLVLISALIVGLILAADEVVVRMARWLGWTSRRSLPAITRGGTALAGAGLAVAGGVASGVANLSSRFTRQEEEEEEAEPARPKSRRKPSKKAEEEEDEEEAPAEKVRQITFNGDDPDDEDEEEEEEEEEDEDEYDDDEDEEEEEEEEEEEDEDELIDEEEATPTGFVTTADKSSAPIVIGAPPAVAPAPTPKPQQRRRQITPEEDDYELPAYELLDASVEVDRASIEVRCREKAFILEQTLNEFRVGIQVVRIDTGPVITFFELKLAPGVKVSQIASLSNDMARALKAPAVRVVAPLPGRNTIGIEVPNVDRERVRLRDIIDGSGSAYDSLGLPLFLGKDVPGKPMVADLTAMPHLLIAGTTGSGKSICVSSIILSILLTRTPSEVSLIMVDPKMVELSAFKDIPHLACPIITDVTKAESILDWAATLMDERYSLLAEAGVRDIRSYNRLGRDGLKERLNISDDSELDRIPVHLPYLVIIIDELADLMMTSAKEVEFNLCRLAQKSRAVGIHLIVSTQRPQANVVTGLIKSNLPSRICFRVASRLDSRIVLDQNGGETLLGQGDMLFLAPGTSKLMRAQGTFVNDTEVRAIVKHCREQRAPDYNPELVRQPGSGGSSTERDELFDQAVDIILETGRGSVSLLQRKLTIGYGRASRLIDQMYEAGIVGEYKGSQAREVIISKDEWVAARNQRDAEEASEIAESHAD